MSCVGAALLARRFGAGTAGALLSGIVFAFAPFHVNHLLHLQTMAAAGLPFVFLFLDRYLETARPTDAAAFGAAAVLTALCSCYFGVFLVLMIPIFLVLDRLVVRRLDAARLAGFALTGSIAAALLVPVAAHYMEFEGEFGFTHSLKIAGRFSMQISSFTRLPDWTGLWSGTALARGRDLSSGFPGVAAAVLLVVGIFGFGASKGERSRQTALAGIALAAAAFALGPVLHVRAGHPISLPSWIPLPGRIFRLVRAVRWPMRIYFFTLLITGVLAGLGLTRLLRNRGRAVRRTIAASILAFVLLEYRPRAGHVLEHSSAVPPPLQMSDAYPFLASEKDLGGVVELPVAEPDGYRTPFLTRSTFASAGHRRRVVAFFGGVPLPPVDNLLAAALRLPSPASRRFLASSGVDRLVMHREWMPPNVGERLCGELRRAGYRPLFEGREATVFDLGRQEAGGISTVLPDSAER
ncbi:MAG: hypothetical protein ACRD16_06010 [Thermoanaerobaculia bacterium]